MKINIETSERINLLRFPLIVGVIFIHSHDDTVAFSGGDTLSIHPSLISSCVINFISEVMARVAVPVLFLLSGFLFFSRFQWSIDNYLAKLRSRIHTLLIPFLFWNILVLVFYAVAQSLPATQVFFNDKKTAVNQFTLLDYFINVFGIGRLPLCYQFWYVREIMFLAILTPIIHLLHKTIPRWFLLIAFILWFFTLLPLYPLSSSAILFYYSGSILAFYNKDLFLFDKFGKYFVASYFVVAMVDVMTKNFVFNQFVHRLGIIFGVISVLYASKFLLENAGSRKFFMWVGNSSFFCSRYMNLLLQS